MKRGIGKRWQSGGPVGVATVYHYKEEIWRGAKAYAAENNMTISAAHVDLVRRGLEAAGRLEAAPDKGEDRISRLEAEFAAFRKFFEERVDKI